MIYRNNFRIYKVIVILICFITANAFIGNTVCKAETNKPETYFYLDDVTPFNDLNNLIDEIDYLKDNGIKFFIEVSPVFVNEDLKAMGKFAECLRYAQANGGIVVMKAPTINSKGMNAKSIIGQQVSEKAKIAFNNFTNYWVYPVAMSVDVSLLYRDDFKDILECTDTLFLNLEDNININDSNHTIKYYNNIIQKVTLRDYMENSKTNMYVRNALCVESDYNFEEFKKKVNEILNREITFTPSNRLSTYMKFDNEVKSNFKGIFLNDKDVTQQRFINQDEYKNSFVKNENNEENPVKVDLTESNRTLEIISGLALLIFLIILILSKNIERKRFFK
jgi:hypothetical protein